MEPEIKIENVFIKEEYTMSDASDYADEDVAINANSVLKEEDLINSQQESYVKEEVIISDITNITGNEASNNDNSDRLLEKNSGTGCTNIFDNFVKIISKADEQLHVLAENTNDLKCPKCPFLRFKNTYTLRSHLRLCGLDMFLKCYFCEFNTKFRGTLKKHLEGVHKNLKAGEIHKILNRARKKEHKLISKVSKPTSNKTKVAPPAKKFNTKDFAKLHCSKCDMTVEKVIWKDRNCTECGTLTHLQCLTCDRRYLSTTSMYAHLKSKCGPKVFLECADCGYQVPTKTRLVIHIERLHTTVAPEDYHKCGNCDKRFRHRQEHQNHEKFCGKMPYLQCELCPYKSKYVIYFKKHVQNHILHPKIDAATVNKGSTDKRGTAGKIPVDASKSRTPTIRTKPMTKKDAARVQALVQAYCSRCTRRTKAITSRRKCDVCLIKLCYRCAECDREYPAVWELREHIASKHLQDELKKQYKCSRCAKSFVVRNKLYNHQVYCGKEADLRCDYCPFRSKYKSHLTRHVRRRHLGVVPKIETPRARESCVCDKCGKTYNGAESLGRHKRLYCGREAKIACDHCDFKSRTKQGIFNHLHRMHLRIFTEEALKCKLCGKESTNLYIHATHVKNCGVK